MTTLQLFALTLGGLWLVVSKYRKIHWREWGILLAMSYVIAA